MSAGQRVHRYSTIHLARYVSKPGLLYLKAVALSIELRDQHVKKQEPPMSRGSGYSQLRLRTAAGHLSERRRTASTAVHLSNRRRTASAAAHLSERRRIASAVVRLWRTEAEKGGFEPPVRFNPYDSLANCWFKPLTHFSGLRANIALGTNISKRGTCIPSLFQPGSMTKAV